MAPISKSLALAGAFFALSGFAAPVEKRELVWQTVTSVVWTTVEVTTTVYPGQLPTAPANPPVAVATPAVAQSEPAVDLGQSLQQKQNEPAVISSTQPAQVPAPAPTEQPIAAVAPQSSSEPAPQPSPEPAPQPSPEPAPQPSPEPASNTAPKPVESSGGGPSGQGDLTYYIPATSMTNPSFCGGTNAESDLVLALPHGVMNNGECGKTVEITFEGKTAKGTVVDKCDGCDNNAIDLSPGLYKLLAAMGRGRVSGAVWHVL